MRLEGNLAGLPTGCASSVKHLTRPTGSTLTLIATGFAPLGLSKALLLKKVLFTRCENELLATIFTNECLVFVH